MTPRAHTGQLLDLPVSITVNRASWVFTLKCKNDKRDHTYDFTAYGLRYPSIVSAFIDALVATRNTIGHNRRRNIQYAIARFLSFLDTTQASPKPVAEFSEITSTVLSNYAAWAKLDKGQKALTQSYRVMAIKPLVEWLRRNHPEAHADLRFERNLFPMAHRSSNARQSYSPEEWNSLLKAIAAEIKDSKARLETRYVSKWKDLPPPLDDVAPYDESRRFNKQHAILDSTEYLIWWVENTTKCQRIGDYALRKLSTQTSSVVSSIGKKLKLGEFGQIQPGLSYIDHFYNWLGFGADYVPRYLGKECPILYTNRFRKPEYLEWYWENALHTQNLPIDELKAKGHYAFYGGVTAVYGGLLGFYERHAIKHKVTYGDLLPYILLLAVRTALNWSTITTLTTDCVRPAPAIAKPDNESPEHWLIDWEKLRAFSKGSTIPTHARHDLMPVSVILRVMQITASFRNGRKKLFISDRGEILRGVQAEVTAFVAKHGLTELDARGQTKPFSLQIARIRPTIAMREYVRTENMSYIQTLLGHRTMGMTVQYISQMDNPALMTKRGVHQEAMFLDLTGNGDVAVALLEAHGLSSSASKALADVRSEHHGLLTSCKSPRNSPQPGQIPGQLCTSDACLSCQNLVVTNRDLHKYFCFLQYHSVLLESGRMEQEAYDLATGEVTYVFDNCVIPKFRVETVDLARRQAAEHPLPEWALEAQS